MITQSELKKLLHYNPETGIFTRLTTTGGTKIGDTVGTKRPTGYLFTHINRKFYQLHRLAYLYMRGYMPKVIDHINHQRADNRWSNLRAASYIINSQNQSPYKNNTSGHMGVTYVRLTNKWKAVITVNCKRISLGHFTNKSDAVAARKEAEIKYGFHKNHGLAKC